MKNREKYTVETQQIYVPLSIVLSIRENTDNKFYHSAKKYLCIRNTFQFPTLSSLYLF